MKKPKFGKRPFAVVTLGSRREPELRLGPLRIDTRLAAGFLRWRLEGSEAADFVHDPFSVEFALQAFESTINRLSFANDDFWHVVVFPVFLVVG
jgi:hypothetical protein